jgi:hypothetical protein
LESPPIWSWAGNLYENVISDETQVSAEMNHRVTGKMSGIRPGSRRLRSLLSNPPSRESNQNGYIRVGQSRIGRANVDAQDQLAPRAIIWFPGTHGGSREERTLARRLCEQRRTVLFTVRSGSRELI